MDSNQRSELIIRNAAKLTEQERMEVAKRILERTPVPTADKRYALMLPIAEETVGRRMSRTRDRDNVTIRRICAYRMMEEGLRISHIAQAMGMHHATVLHYIRQMKDSFDEPIFYAEDIRQYIKFAEAVEEAEHHVEE